MKGISMHMKDFKFDKIGNLDEQGFYKEHTDTEILIELENIVTKHIEHLERLIRYSVRGILNYDDFILELYKMQVKTISSCISRLPEPDKKRVLNRLYQKD